MKATIKINKKNLLKEKAGISYFQILMLLLYTFSICYLIAMANAEIVEAQSEALHCCPEMKEELGGAICQEIVNTKCVDECEVSCLPTRCEQHTACKLGCCFDDIEGTCATNTPKQKCENDGGSWSDNAACNIPECQLGCCILGSGTSFVTEKRCEKLAGFYGFEKDFRPEVNTEIGCITLAEVQDEGACVIIEGEDKNCKFTSNQDCLNLNGKFYKDYLCSHSSLDTICEKQVTTECVEGKDGVYWFDSCGNKENIYSSDKEASWNNGVVLKKEDSCGAESTRGNVNSKSCGNCNYFLGSRCGAYKRGVDPSSANPEYGNYICRDMSCSNAPYVVDAFGKIIQTKNRKNGESWCVYDSRIGKGRDVVGSRHFKYMCIDGEIKVEPCADYRNLICVQDDVELPDGDEFAMAGCRINRWQECISYNLKGDNEDAEDAQERAVEQCNENSDCYVREIDVDEGFEFNFCVPRYPPGFDISTEAGGKVGEKICSIASGKCTVIYVKEIDGDWECEANCDCEDAEFTEEMNDFCRSLGDCGAYVNIAERVTTGGYKVKKSDELSSSFLNNYKKFTHVKEGEVAEPGDISEFAGYLGFPTGSGEAELEAVGGWTGIFLGTTIGAAGVAFIAAYLAHGWALAEGGIGAFFIGILEVPTSTAAGFAGVGLGAAAGGIVGWIIAKLFGLPESATFILVIAGIATGLVLAFVVEEGILSWAFFGWLSVILIIIALILKWLGIGDTKEKTVSFKCLPWQPPTGGDDCSKCNQDDILKPCSRYRCASLGQACEFINQGTEKEMCIWLNPNDRTAPVISAWKINKTYDYDIGSNEHEIKDEDGECFREFTPVMLGVNTDEPAQCKVDVAYKPQFEDMDDYFGSSVFIYNHSMPYVLPSLSSLGITGFDPSRYSEFKFYIKCQDKNGNYNPNDYIIKTCVKPGPDVTPPTVVKTSPENNGYIAFGQTEKDITVWWNEPAECKWSKSSEKTYTDMENEMKCNNGIEQWDGIGWSCYVTLTGLTADENKFYFRCIDQPWLAGTDEESERNVNEQGYSYILHGSASNLSITNIEPKDGSTITGGTEPMTIILKAETAGGAESGVSKCQFRAEGSNHWIDFFNTFSTTHTFTFNMIITGMYKYYIKCEDVAGNTAVGQTAFNVRIDVSFPRVVRVYRSGGNLKLITDDDAECAYSETNCNFAFDDEGVTMMSGTGTEHTASWDSDITYYIKCRDEYGNMPGGCSIIVRGVDLS